MGRHQCRMPLLAGMRIYLELTGLEKYEDQNPLLETTPYFAKYTFPGEEEDSTTVTIGYYEGIRELFLKVGR